MSSVESLKGMGRNLKERWRSKQDDRWEVNCKRASGEFQWAASRDHSNSRAIHLLETRNLLGTPFLNLKICNILQRLIKVPKNYSA